MLWSSPLDQPKPSPDGLLEARPLHLPVLPAGPLLQEQNGPLAQRPGSTAGVAWTRIQHRHPSSAPGLQCSVLSNGHDNSTRKGTGKKLALGKRSPGACATTLPRGAAGDLSTRFSLSPVRPLAGREQRATGVCGRTCTSLPLPGLGAASLVSVQSRDVCTVHSVNAAFAPVRSSQCL